MTIRPRKSILLRLGLIGVGLVLFQTASILWILAESFLRPGALIFSGIAWVFGMSCFVLALVRSLSPRVGWLILVGLIVAVWGSAYVEMLNISTLIVPHAEDEMIGEYSAEALRRGFNPFAWNFSDATRVYRDPGIWIATFLDGTQQNRVTYPALTTLVLFAFGTIGLGQARDVSLIFYTLMLLLLFVGAPARLRPIVLMPIFIVKPFNLLTLGGMQDIVWSTLLVAMVLAWKRPTLRAVLFGLACAFRQQPWLAAPFLLISIWNESGIHAERGERASISSTPEDPRNLRLAFRDPRVHAVLYFAGLSLGVFLLINLPFMLWDFKSWALGVFEPTYAAFNVYSHGLGALSQYGLVPFPRQYYTALQISSLLLMLVIHWRHPGEVGQAFWVFPGIFFWLYYRGLTNYWLYWIPPLLIAIARYRWQVTARTETGQRWRPTAALSAAVIAINLTWGTLLLQQPPAIAASLSYPIKSFDERNVAQLGLIVANSSDGVLRPHFSVQHDGLQPLPWEIDSGPEQLLPGESALYIISNFGGWRDFAAARGAQVVITDGSNDSALRTVVDVPGDPSFDSPDQIINPAFIFWSFPQNNPSGWSWYTSENGASRPTLDRVDGRLALVFSPQNGTQLLSQTVTFPDPFSIWVRPVALPTDESREIYGLQFDDAQHRLRVLFGDREGSEQVNENVAVVYVRAPLDQWSRQEIDPAGLYARFGWDLPPYSIRSRQGLEFAARQMTLRLIVSGLHASHAFGPIEQDSSFASPRSLVEEAISHPDDYYVNMGDEYCRQRNVDLAREAYRRALDYNPGNTFARLGVESCP